MADEILELVKTHDKDRYLASLLIPDEHRDAVLALYAFNVEIARVRNIVSEPMIGEIRLQWWRDVLKSEDENAGQGHPVATALLDTIATYNLDVGSFDKMIAARASDLYDDLFNDWVQFEGYAGESTSLLFNEAAKIMGEQPGRELADAAGYAGVVWRLVEVIRSFAFDSANTKIYVPKYELDRFNVTADAIYKGRVDQGFGDLWRAVLVHIRERYDEFRQSAAGLSAGGKLVFRHMTLVEPYLKRAEKLDYNPFQSPLEISQLQSQWRFWRYSL